MSAIQTFPPGTIGQYDYVVMLSHYNGKLLLSRHKGRETWEMQGGHIEPGETPEEAARRELYEESGAVNFDMTPLCDYRGQEPGKNNYGCGMVFSVDIRELTELPESEMGEIRQFDNFPDELTYPNITGAILKYTEK